MLLPMVVAAVLSTCKYRFRSTLYTTMAHHIGGSCWQAASCSGCFLCCKGAVPCWLPLRRLRARNTPPPPQHFGLLGVRLSHPTCDLLYTTTAGTGHVLSDIGDGQENLGVFRQITGKGNYLPPVPTRTVPYTDYVGSTRCVPMRKAVCAAVVVMSLRRIRTNLACDLH